MSFFNPNWHARLIGIANGEPVWAAPINPDCGPTKATKRRTQKQLDIYARNLGRPAMNVDMVASTFTIIERPWRVENNKTNRERWRAHIEKERLRRRLEKARKRRAPHTPIDSDGIRKVLKEFWSTPLISSLLEEDRPILGMVPIVPSCVYKSCGKPAHRKKDRSFSVYCADHLKKNVDRSNKRSRDLKDAGRCCQCGTGEIANIGGWRCRACLDFNNEKRRSGT